MSKITPENINDYYEKINSLIDDYFGHGISPIALKKYFKKGGYGISKFLNRNELDEIENSEKIIHDVIEDRLAMDESTIMAFESFMSEKNQISNKVNIFFETGIEEEKYLADNYRVSLGHINKLSDNNYNITGLKFSKEVFIYNEEQLKNIISQLSELIYETVSKKEISIDFLNINFSLQGKIEKETFTQQMNLYLVKNFTVFLPELISHETGNKYIHKEKKGNYYLFEKSD